jgi:hypothetical protein
MNIRAEIFDKSKNYTPALVATNLEGLKKADINICHNRMITI